MKKIYKRPARFIAACITLLWSCLVIAEDGLLPISINSPHFSPPAVSLAENNDTVVSDPTRPPNLSPTTTLSVAQPFALTAIFIYPHYKIAIIGNRAMMEGDHLDQYIITTIRPDAVELVGPKGKMETLDLHVLVKNKHSEGSGLD